MGESLTKEDIKDSLRQLRAELGDDNAGSNGENGDMDDYPDPLEVIDAALDVFESIEFSFREIPVRSKHYEAKAELRIRSKRNIQDFIDKFDFDFSDDDDEFDDDDAGIAFPDRTVSISGNTGTVSYVHREESPPGRRR